jgi:hypothetical protein
LKEQSLATFDKILIPSLLTYISWASGIQMWLMLAHGFFGVVMQYKQNDVNDFVKILQENHWVFTKEIIETQEFKDWFVVVLEEYIKERNKTKKEIIKNIFLWFIKLSKEEKKEYKLERLINITKLITFEEILMLQKLKENQSISIKWKEIVETNQQWKIINTSLSYEKLPQIIWNKMYPISLSKNKIPIIDTLYWLVSLWLICSINLIETKEFNLTSLWYEYNKYINNKKQK